MEKSNKHGVLVSFLLHIHPKKIDSEAVKFNRSFGLGGLAAMLFVILFITGLILRFSYVPTVEHAYNSILNLQQKTLFGRLIRNIHYLSANLMVAVTFLHLIRVYFSNSIYGKRSKNWNFGLVLLFLILSSAFTGYLLPWNQLSFWAVTVVTQIIEYIPFIGSSLANVLRGGSEVNGNTLLNFYTLHTGIIPIAIIVFMSLHFWLVRKAGGLALPEVSSNKIKKVEVKTSLIPKEIMFATVSLALIFLIAMFWDAPLLEQANPLKSPNPIKAPWYFLGVQELLINLHPIFSIVIIPLLVILFLIYLPQVKLSEINSGVWFNSKKNVRVIIKLSIIAFVYTFILIIGLEKIIEPHLFVFLPQWINEGVFPFLLYVIPISMYVVVLKKMHKPPLVEILMYIVTIILSSYICMILIALLLRGKGMSLIF